MNNSEIIYFNFFSICSLIPAVFGIILSLFLLRLKNRTSSTTILGMNLIFLSMFYFAYFISSALYHPLAAYHRIFTISGSLLCMSFFTFFVFHFPDPYKPKFSKILFSIQISGILILTIAFIFSTIFRAQIEFNFSNHAYDFSKTPIEKLTPLIILFYLTLVPVFGVIRAIRKPSGKRKEIIFIAFTAYLTLLIPSITNLLSRYGIVSRAVYQVTQDLSTLSGYYIIVIIYLNSGKEKTTFIMRIIAITFATILIAFQLLSFFALKEQEDAFFIIKETESKARLDTQSLLARLKFEFNKSGLETTIIKNNINTNSDGIIFHRTREILLSQKNILQDKESGTPHYISTGKDNYILFFTKSTNSIYASIYDYRTLRLFVQPQSQTFIIIILITIFAMLFGYKSVFLYSITKPLENLQNGINNVNQGNYNIKVPVAVEDEIGYITRNFNNMVSLIKTSEKQLSDYANNLEAKVKERTDELQQSLSELETAQKQLIEQEKMALLGSLVAGVAHEINTPLGVCVTAVSHLKKNTNSAIKDFQAEKITKTFFENYLKNTLDSSEIIIKNLESADTLIRSFKQIAVDQSDESHREFDAKEYINDILHSLAPQLKENNISISITNSDENFYIDNYPGALYQVITNLIMNSIIHAFPKNFQPKPEITIRCFKEANYVKVIYQDNGCGMDSQTVNKIYNPFFTTKRSEGSSGLGMNIVFNKVTGQMQGKIEIESSPGNGVKFSLLIPPLKNH